MQETTSLLPVSVSSLILSSTLLTFVVFSLFFTHKIRKRVGSIEEERDIFFSARNSQSWWTLSLSFYVAGMGSWLLFAPPETGMFAGWIGAIAYGLSNASPFWIMIWLGPKVKAGLGGSRGFTVADFFRERYGRQIQAVASVVSLCFMFVFLSAELTSIGGVVSSVSDGFPPVAAIVPVSVITVAYVCWGGAPASILTDRVQGILVLVLGFSAIFVVSRNIIPELAQGSLIKASEPTSAGIYGAVVLWISTTLNQFLDQGMWQRVFASHSQIDAQLGLFLGGLLAIPTVTLFACTGILANAATISGIIRVKPGTESMVFFVLVRRLPAFWLGLVVLLGVGLVCSTVDSLQSGLMGLIASELMASKRSLMWARLGCIVINVLATLVAVAQYSVLSLFLISNIISCSIVPMLGLAFNDRISPMTAFIGIVSGLASIVICGWVSTKNFIGGLTWFILPDGPYSRTTAITFIVTPVATTITTIIGGYLHCWKAPHVRDAQRNRLLEMKGVAPSERKPVFTSSTGDVTS